jgi:hypothetical protein
LGYGCDKMQYSSSSYRLAVGAGPTFQVAISRDHAGEICAGISHSIATPRAAPQVRV